MTTDIRRIKKTGTVVTACLLSAGVLLLLGSIGVGTATVVAPEKAEEVYGSAKLTITETVTSLKEEVTGELPTLQLGGTGGQQELDTCNGAFTLMTSYQTADFSTPVWAAHNACGGDVILNWVEGQRVRVAGGDKVYEVVDSITVVKTWSSTTDIAELEGELILQTCFYGSEEMRFVGLKPVN